VASLKAMPRPRAPKPNPDEIYVAWTSFTTQGWDVRRGSRLRGDHEAVKTCPRFFVLDGTPTDEIPHELSIVPEHPPPDPGARAAKIPEPIPDDDAVICTMQFTVLATGRLIPKGAILRRDDPDVIAYPYYFTRAPTALEG